MIFVVGGKEAMEVNLHIPNIGGGVLNLLFLTVWNFTSILWFCILVTLV